MITATDIEKEYRIKIHSTSISENRAQTAVSETYVYNLMADNAIAQDQHKMADNAIAQDEYGELKSEFFDKRKIQHKMKKSFISKYSDWATGLAVRGVACVFIQDWNDRFIM